MSTLLSIPHILLALALLAVLTTGCPSPVGNGVAGRTLRPEAVDALDRARAALNQKDYQTVLVLADTADRYERNLVHTDFLRGQVYVDTYQLEKADSMFKKVHAADPYYRGVWFKLGQSAFLRSEYKTAIRFFEKEKALIDASPQRIRRLYRDVDHDGLIAVDLQIGRCYQKSENADSARFFYHSVLVRDPNNANGHAWLAELLQEAGDLERALDHAERAYQNHPDDLEYAYLSGALLFRNGRAQDAVERLKTVVKRKPWHEGANYNLGQALQRLGRTGEAHEFLVKADTLARLSYRIQMAETAAYVQKTSPQRWLILADLYLAAGRAEDAQGALQTAHYLLPRNLSIQNDLANLALVRGDTTGAFFQFIRILKQDSTFADGWINLGVIYALSDRKQDARMAWKQAQKYRPGDETVRAYLASVSGR